MKTRRKHNGGYVVQKYQHVDSQLKKLSSMNYEIEEDYYKNQTKNMTFLKMVLVSIICYVSSILLHIIVLHTSDFESRLIQLSIFLIVCVGTVLGLYTLIKRVFNVNQSFIGNFLMVVSAYVFTGFMVFYFNESRRLNVKIYGSLDLMLLGIVIIVSHIAIVKELWDF